MFQNINLLFSVVYKGGEYDLCNPGSSLLIFHIFNSYLDYFCPYPRTKKAFAGSWFASQFGVMAKYDIVPQIYVINLTSVCGFGQC